MYRLQVLTPEEVIFDGDAIALIAPGTLGYLGILTDHAPLISSLKAGLLVITDAAAIKHFYKVEKGVVQADHNQVAVLVHSIQPTAPVDLVGGF